MMMSAPALLNLSAVLTVLVYVYALVGVQLFTFVRHQSTLTDDRNFDTFGNAILVLLQCLGHDGWSYVMEDALITESSDLGCTDAAGDCGGWFAVPYFVSFQIVASFVLLNILVAVILNDFTSLGRASNNLVTVEKLDVFHEIWEEFDPDATQRIHAEELPALVRKLPEPLGIRGAPRKWGFLFCLHLQLHHHHWYVEFHDVLKALINYNYLKETGEALPNAEVADTAQQVVAHIADRTHGSMRRTAEQVELAELFAKGFLSCAVERRRKAKARQLQAQSLRPTAPAAPPGQASKLAVKQTSPPRPATAQSPLLRSASDPKHTLAAPYTQPLQPAAPMSKLVASAPPQSTTLSSPLPAAPMSATVAPTPPPPPVALAGVIIPPITVAPQSTKLPAAPLPPPAARTAPIPRGEAPLAGIAGDAKPWASQYEA